MKKILYIFLFLFICGCEGYNPNDIQSLTNKVDSVCKVEFEGHTYIMYHHGYRGGICHDENCKCKFK